MNRSASFSWPSLVSFTSLAVVTAVSLTACSGGQIAVGSQASTLKTRDGGATGDGTTCSWDDAVSSDGTVVPSGGTRYKVGETMPGSCNACTCTEQGIACTMQACDVDGGGGACSYGGNSYAVGASFPSTDGCNTCTCAEGGGVACTEKACAYTCPAEKTIDCMPMVAPERQYLCTGPYHEWIGANCEVQFAF